MYNFLIVLCAVGAAVCVPMEFPITPEPGETCGYESCMKTEKGVLNVHIVPHTHDDVGWLKTVDQYYYGSRNNIQKAGVQYILDSVIKELWEDPKRRFIYVETAFFWKWWMRQPDAVKQKVHTLVRQGRLQFVGGAWSMNDEAATHYQSTIDQFTWGLSKLNKTFGTCGLPRVGWQIDPFGHSREFASLLAGMGYDGLFLGRIDYEDKGNRKKQKTMEMLWRGDDDLGKASDIFTGVLYNTYSPPPGFCFDVLCSDEPIIDDPDSPMFNVDKRVEVFLQRVIDMKASYRTNSILVTMGDDFHYQDANMWFSNLDKLIKYTNMKSAKEGLNVKLFYSTPDCYLKAVKESNPTLPTKQDDFFPYASDPTAFWTGYFTSRPTTKYFEREGNNYLQVVKQLQVLAALQDHNMFVVNELKSAMGVMQHHDAVTGTEKTHVTHDYERIMDQAIDDALIVAKQAFNKISQGDLPQPPTVSYKRCHFNESRCRVSELSQKFIVTVYNPLAWTLDATPVRLPVESGSYSVFGPDGKEVTTQLIELPRQVLKIPTRVSRATHELVYLAEGVPGLGFKSYYVQKKDQRSRRDVEFNSEDMPLLKKFKRRNDFYQSMNDYWRNVIEKDYVSIQNIEDNPQMTRSEAKRKITEDPIDPNVMFIKGRYADRARKNNEEGNKKVITSQVQSHILAKLKSSLNDDEMRMLSDDPLVVERYPEDSFLENEKIKVRINNISGQITHVILPDGTETPFSIQSLYYPGCVGNNEEYAKRSSGAYIFRPNATKATELLRNESKVFKGPVVDEVQFTSSDFTSYVVRIYKNAKLNFIENEWLVGPIPIFDDVGKEVIVRYVTDIVNNGAFYTDSNGRQMLKRRLNQRPQWNLTLAEPIAGNYYPVTNKIYIEDDYKRFSVITDRAEGGSSLLEGNIELMLHRRLLHDDSFGVGEALNETAKGIGLVARGKHRLYLSKPSDKNAKVNEKKGPLEEHLQPLVLVADGEDIGLDQWLKMKNVYSGLKNSLPDGLHLLTLEPWDGSLLIRLENYLEKNDRKDGSVQVDLSNLFKNLKIKSLKETTLSANQWLKDYEKWSWKKDGDFYNNFNREYGSFTEAVKAKDDDHDVDEDGDDLKVKVKAKQIRTFVASYDFVGDM